MTSATRFPVYLYLRGRPLDDPLTVYVPGPDHSKAISDVAYDFSCVKTYLRFETADEGEIFVNATEVQAWQVGEMESRQEVTEPAEGQHIRLWCGQKLGWVEGTIR